MSEPEHPKTTTVDQGPVNSTGRVAALESNQARLAVGAVGVVRRLCAPCPAACVLLPLPAPSG